MKQTARIILTLTLLTLAPVSQVLAQASGAKAVLEFALIGDNPYTDYNQPKYERLIERINQRDMAFVIHLGDMKSSIQSCSDQGLESLRELNYRFSAPFVLTPGDNDWFDCARLTAGAWDRQERLKKLRQIFFPIPGETDGLRVANQPGFPENAFWHQQGVTFATLHLVGVTGTEGGMDLHEELMQAAVAWISTVFNRAAKVGSAGVFMATQADPWLFSAEPGSLQVFCPDCPTVRPGYEALQTALLEHARDFPGPVVLAVGDTHIFRVDKPLYDDKDLIDNFTRVQAFGHPNVHWVRVVINPKTSSLFEFHQEIVPENTTDGWRREDRNSKRR